MTDGKKIIISAIIAIALVILAAAILSTLGCARVSYKKITGNTKCDMAIMCAELKSIKGNEAFEITGFIQNCYSDLDRAECKKEHFGTAPVSYDKKDEKYQNYLLCLADKK
jgi:hypothetical protein